MLWAGRPTPTIAGQHVTDNRATAEIFACTTWNIHRARGNDGAVDPARSLTTLLSEVWRPDTDAIVLTEADAEAPPHRGLLDLPALCLATGLRHGHEAAAFRLGPDSHGFHGVLILLRADATVHDVAILDLPGVCHRGAVVIDFDHGGQALRLVGTHLSLGQPARIAQMRTIGQHLARRTPRPVVVAGDLNEWRPWGGLALSRIVTGLALTGRARASFPAGRPILPLDRILVSAPGRVTAQRVLDGPGIRAASDHRPVRAEIRVDPTGRPPPGPAPGPRPGPAS